jgi:hypothetical protein
VFISASMDLVSELPVLRNSQRHGLTRMTGAIGIGVHLRPVLFQDMGAGRERFPARGCSSLGRLSPKKLGSACTALSEEPFRNVQLPKEKVTITFISTATGSPFSSVG